MAIKTSTEPTKEEFQAQLAELEVMLERLRVRYEQYFLGIERIAPTTMRTQVARLIRVVENSNLRNTALKFRRRGLIQKFHTYSTYWNRTMREIENGTYKRHKERAQRRADSRPRGRNRARKKEEEVPVEETEEMRVAREAKAAELKAAANDFLAEMATSIDIDFGELDKGFDSGFGHRPDSGLKPTFDVFGRSNTPVKTPILGQARPTPPSGIRAPSRGPGSATKADSGGSQVPQAPPRRPGLVAPGGPPRPGDREAATAPPIGQRAKPLPGARQRPSRKKTPAAAGFDARDKTARSGVPEGAKRSQRKELYDQFVAARERLGRNKKALSFDKFERSLVKQESQVRATHKCKTVDFRVVVKDGKPYLKPIPQD